jgi:hypothetical protein
MWATRETAARIASNPRLGSSRVTSV